MALARANYDAAENRVVEPYAIEVKREGARHRGRAAARAHPRRRADHRQFQAKTRRPRRGGLRTRKCIATTNSITPSSSERVAQFRDQVGRRLSGELDEEQFKPLRLQNGVYLQLHAYMLRIAVPYGTLNPRQMRQLAYIARNYDKGYGHFTTRQNLQFNWPRLEDVPDILAKLAEVEMHCIQTSGNCIRNVTADHFAGVSADEVADPRPYAEILRQWSSLHPEFLFLPRKFKIAVTGAPVDRAAIQFHDIGYEVKRNAEGELGFAVYIGGGMGRTPDARQEDPRLPAGGGPARLFRGDPARLQHARTARQQIQGAHQDPRPRDRHGGDRRGDRGRVRGEPPRRAAPARGRGPPHRRLFRPAGLCRAARRERRRSSARASPIRPSTAGCATT